MKKILSFLMAIAFLFVVAACGDKTEELLKGAKDSLTITTASGDSLTSITKNVTLVTKWKEATVTWASSDTSVIANDGKVTRPSHDAGNKEVTLTATLTVNKKKVEKPFTLTVIAMAKTDAEKLAEAKAALAITFHTGEDKDSIKNHLTLPVTEGGATVTWNSSNPAVISNAGQVARPSFNATDAVVALTATLTIGSINDTKVFPVKVLKNESVTDAELVAETKNAIIVNNHDTTATGNFLLPVVGSNGSTISWKSDNAAIVIETIVKDGFITAKIVRPEYGEADATVKLVATITNGDVTDTSEYEIKVFAIDSLPTPIADFKLTAKEGDSITFKAIVIGFKGVEHTGKLIKDTYKGAYLYDGTQTIYWHNKSELPKLNIGDEIQVNGKYGINYGVPQVIDVTYDLLSTGNSLPVPTVITLADLPINGVRDSLHANYVRLQGVFLTKNDDYYQITQDGITYTVWDQTIASNGEFVSGVLDNYINKTVNINVLANDYHTTSKIWRLVFANHDDDIEEVSLSEQEMIDQAKALINFPSQIDSNLEFITSTPSGVTIEWSSSHPEIISNEGKVVLPEVETDVTLTATFTYGDKTDTKEIIVTVLTTAIPNLTVKEALLAEDNAEIKVEGIVVANAGTGYILYSDGAYGLVYTNAQGTAKVGDLVALKVTMGTYRELRQLQNPELLQTISSNNELPIFIATTITQLIAREVQFGFITVDVSIEGNFNNVYLTDASGNKVEVYHQSTTDYKTTEGAILKQFNGKNITLPVFIYQTNSGASNVLFLGGSKDITVNNATVAETVKYTDGTTVIVKNALVIANSGYGYVVYSDGEFGFVHTNAVGTLTIGDIIDLKVTLGSYKNLKQLQNPTDLVTVSSDNELPTINDATLAELIAREATAGTVIVKVTVEGDYNNVYLTDIFGNKVQVYHKSTPDYESTTGAVLKAFENKLVKLPVIMYQDGLVLFVGSASDVVELTDRKSVV